MREKKIKKKNTQNIRRTLKTHISAIAKQIRLKFGMECALPEGLSTTKMVQFCPGINELQMHETAVSWLLYSTHLSVMHLYQE